MSYIDTEIEDDESETADSRRLAAEPEKKAPKRSSAAVRWGIPAALLLIAAASLAAVSYYKDVVSTDDAQVDGHIVPVASKIYGNVQEVLVTDNQEVKAGDLLVRIDARDYEAKVAQARAALSLAEGQARAARCGVPLARETSESGASAASAQLAAAEADHGRANLAYELASTSELAAARAAVEARQAANDRAQADLNRMSPLVAKAEISRQHFDGFAAAARVAAAELRAAQEKFAGVMRDAEMRRATVQAARATVKTAQANLQAAKARTRQTDISAAQAAAAEAAVEQARANLQAVELQLSYATITAPIDGVVTRKTVEAGQIVQPGQGMLSVIPLHRIWVTANFKETQLGNVRAGQKAEVTVDMYGETFTGRVESIAGATGTRLSLLPPENATGNYVKVVQRIPVKIALDPIPRDKAVLRPGMNVEATIRFK